MSKSTDFFGFLTSSGNTTAYWGPKMAGPGACARSSWRSCRHWVEFTKRFTRQHRIMESEIKWYKHPYVMSNVHFPFRRKVSAYACTLNVTVCHETVVKLLARNIEYTTRSRCFPRITWREISCATSRSRETWFENH